MKKKVRCLRCNEPLVEIELDEAWGHISVLQGCAEINNWTDGTQTVDFYCDTCKEEV